MESPKVDQTIREAVPDRCKDCPTMWWRVQIVAEKMTTDEPKELEAAKQELVEDLDTWCRYGTRSGRIGMAACRYGVLCEFPSYEDRQTLDGMNTATDQAFTDVVLAVIVMQLLNDTENSARR